MGVIHHPQVLAVVPTIGRSPYWPDLLAHLVHDPAVVRVWVSDNSPELTGRRQTEEALRERLLPRAKVTHEAREERSIYPAWNSAISLAKAWRADYVCALNDDIEVASYPPLIDELARMMREHRLDLASPTYDQDHLPIPISSRVDLTRGTYRHGGIAGFAWMARAETCPLIDPGFQWWGGDDDLALNVERNGGRIGLIRSVGIRHHPSTTANGVPWTSTVLAADREHMIRTWGHQHAW